MCLSGVLVIDKPKGLTSHDVVMEVKKTIKARKVGHTGTLDPIATGVLPLCIDRATRFARFLEGDIKEYIATMKLGEETDTYDLEGGVVSKGDWSSLTKQDILSTLKGFNGKVQQVPPMFSAIKKDGIPLYKLARLGVTVDRKPKEVYIHEIKPIEVTTPYVTFSVVCSKGTYIRSLCFDIGRRLGCGAHLVALRRVRSGRFSIMDSLPLGFPSLRDKILPIEEVFKELPGIEVDYHMARRIRDGLFPGGIGNYSSLLKDYRDRFRDGEMMRFISNGRFIGLGQYQGQGRFKIMALYHEYSSIGS